MTIPKRQHWVPRFYLRHFAVPSVEKRTDQVWIFHRKTGDPQLVNVNNIAVEKHLYSPVKRDGARDGRLEQKLAELEHVAAELWPSLVSDLIDLGEPNVRRTLGLFLAVQFLRHPERRSSTQQVHDQLVSFFNQLPRRADGTPDIDWVKFGTRIFPVDTSDWQSFTEDDPEADAQWLNAIETSAERYAEMLMAKRWSVVFVDSPRFITSDYPLYVPQPELSRSQIGASDAIIMFPISPTRVLCMDDLNEPANRYYHLSDDDADIYNCMTWVNTDSFIISPRDIYDVLTGIERVRREAEADGIT